GYLAPAAPTEPSRCPLESVRLGTTGFMGTLATTEKVWLKNNFKMIGIRVGMVDDIYERASVWTTNAKPESRIPGWPPKVYRCKGGEPHIVTIEVRFFLSSRFVTC